jgi:sulfatase modifying factor 1
MRPSRAILFACAAIAAALLLPRFAPAGNAHGMLAAAAVHESSRCVPPARDPLHAIQPVPAGMTVVPGGTFSMGSDNPRLADARPWHRVHIRTFALARAVVTNEEFARFVKATGYVTIAERVPSAADVPGVPAEDRVPGALVFTPPDHPVLLDDDSLWWQYVRDANWRHPHGPGSSISGKDRDPVVQVAYDDALAYARWMHARLPTEAEYEYAERGGLDCTTYAWGNDEMPGGSMPANIYMGHFPDRSTNGRPDVKPVGSYPANGFGLYDMSGNVWEWTADWYRADYYATLAASGAVSDDPAGPRDSEDPVEPGVAKRSVRGGSFLCTDQFCSRFEAGGRGEAEPHSAADHTGFRIARSL